MKLNYAFFQGNSYEKPKTPTLEDRINFLESTLRRVEIHEPLCDSRLTPEYGKVNWWRRTVIIKTYECDCWLSEPFGTVGLREFSQ